MLGLVPDVPVARVASVGNAAGAGAVRALLSRPQRAEIEAPVCRVEKIETATEPRFQELFVNAMGFPHTSDTTPNLAVEIALPSPPKSALRQRDLVSAPVDAAREPESPNRRAVRSPADLCNRTLHSAPHSPTRMPGTQNITQRVDVGHFCSVIWNSSGWRNAGLGGRDE